MSQLKNLFVSSMSISIISQYSLLKERKRFSAMKRRVPKNTQTFHKKINPHPKNLPQSTSELLPDPNKASTNKLDPIIIKDSAVNICSLNIRSLTIKEDSIKLKILFTLNLPCRFKVTNLTFIIFFFFFSSRHFHFRWL